MCAHFHRFPARRPSRAICLVAPSMIVVVSAFLRARQRLERLVRVRVSVPRVSVFDSPEPHMHQLASARNPYLFISTLEEVSPSLVEETVVLHEMEGGWALATPPSRGF
uniref:Uncharacterized protein n=1 Tax=Anopheles atroparvus TaxID=41427 RepID=A0AAG5CZ48_ANOAO